MDKENFTLCYSNWDTISLCSKNSLNFSTNQTHEINDSSEINFSLNEGSSLFSGHQKPDSDLEEIFFDSKQNFEEKSLGSTKINSFNQIVNPSSEISNQKEIYQCLQPNNKLTFEYLNSSKIYDPKHLPIEDKGIVYYFQDDPTLYRKIKK